MSEPSDHTHESGNTFHETLEQTAMFTVAGIGIIGNISLFILVIIQRHTRTMSSSFIMHACFLNIIQAAYCIPFGHGLQAERVPTSTCNSLGISYIVLMTASVFNLVALACCEVYIFDNHCATHRKRPKSSVCCILFGIFLVYVGSIILHLGPTIIGGNFEEDTLKRCLFVYDQEKNYIVYTMWILIVSIALASATYYLAIFYRVIRKTVEAKLVALTSQQDEINVSMDVVDSKLDGLAGIKNNRHRVLAAITIVYFVSWYPLYFLILVDPKYKVTVELYKSLTILGYSKACIEPFIFLIMDKQVNRIMSKYLPCKGREQFTTEDEVNTWLKVTERKDLDQIDHQIMEGEMLEGGLGGPGCSSTSQTGSDSGIGSRQQHSTVSGYYHKTSTTIPLSSTGWRGSQDLENRYGAHLAAAGSSNASSPTRTAVHPQFQQYHQPHHQSCTRGGSSSRNYSPPATSTLFVTTHMTEV